jgi:gliding motility-associated-like protein
LSSVNLFMIKVKKFLIILTFFLTSSSSWGSVSFTSTRVCQGLQTTLTGSSSTGDSFVSSWNWDLDNDGDFNDAVGKIVNYIFPQADTFMVGLKVLTTFGGKDSVISQVIINPLPQVNFHVDNLCEGKLAVYKDVSSISAGAIVQYNWDFNNDGITDDNSGPIASFGCGPASLYVTKLECVSDMGCKAFTTKTTEVFHQPAAGFTASGACIGDTVRFTNTTTVVNDNISIYKWDFGDASAPSALEHPSHSFSSAASYPVTLIAISQHNCRDTVKKNITVRMPPAAQLLFSGDTVLYKGESVTVTATGPDITSYKWSTGDTTSSVTATKSGILSVKLTDSHGCSALKSVRIIAKTLEELEVGNDIITPNGDGINDFFVIENVEAYRKCTLTIYNIWNKQVYSVTGYRNDWEGTYNGSPLDAGTYYYMLKCGDSREKSGSINILR